MLSLLTVFALLAQPTSPPNPYLQTTTEANGVFSLKTGAHRLTAPGKPDVWLVGAAHVGTKEYYTELQKLLDAQGVVLFEGVRPKAGAKPPPSKTSPGTSQQKSIYQVLSTALGLDFQLTDINYAHANWVDSDLSMDDLERLNKAAANGKPTEFDMLEKLLDPNSQMAQQFAGAMQAMPPGAIEGLKLFFVKRLSTLDPGAAISDPATAKVILTARNESAEAYFDRAISAPAAPFSVAIFYGALHQPAIESDLVRKYGYKVAETRWFKAATADTKKVDAQGQMIYSILDKQLGGGDAKN